MAATVLHITLRPDASIRYANTMGDIVDDLLELIPDWQQGERDRLVERFSEARDALVKHGLRPAKQHGE